ncbi:substrate-binding domain-containing protein [Salsipaludibacter albus]|uniref:substrate-binding domain-containing protein n=1 Tax=Salsipaludibacter albus TaxID=2849650 RepID=UPI001EE43521
MDGWRTTLEDAGRDVPPVRVGDWSASSGYELGRELLAETDATAVFVGNDPMALGLYRAVREAGLSIPDDISVVGFDDVPEAAFYAPPLTTVRQDFDEVGTRSLRVLLAGVEGTEPDVDLEVPVTLVERASTAPRPRA